MGIREWRCRNSEG
uniref:Uncharacterized protein n=1 Tax=Anguilla anguilla TaxID=7936 RepID=A0A0E9P535_ANGAN